MLLLKTHYSTPKQIPPPATFDQILQYLESKTFATESVEWSSTIITVFIDDQAIRNPNTFGRDIIGIDSPVFGHLLITGGTSDTGELLSVPEHIDITKYISHIKYKTKA